MLRVYVDGQHGTTGLRLGGLLRRHPSIELLELPHAERRDRDRRRGLMEESDLVAFCLPSGAVSDALDLLPSETRALDASNAHRCADGWVYGLPELGADQRHAIAAADRVSNPGCFATAFILAVWPLVLAGTIAPRDPVHCFALTGYSAGGARMIERHEAGLDAARLYSLDLDHRHLPEMRVYSGLDAPPTFIPVVGAHREGMHLTVPVPAMVGRDELLETYRERYRGEPFVRVVDEAPSHLSPVHEQGSNAVAIYVTGSSGRHLVSVRLNNLVKGAAGTAVQNINLMLGLDESEGLS